MDDTYESLVEKKRVQEEATRQAAEQARAAIGQHEPMDSQKTIGAAIATILPIIAGSVIAGKRGALIGGMAGAAGGGSIINSVIEDRKLSDTRNSELSKQLSIDARAASKAADSFTKSGLDSEQRLELANMSEAGRNSRSAQSNAARIQAAEITAGGGGGAKQDWLVDSMGKITTGGEPDYTEGARLGVDIKDLNRVIDAQGKGQDAPLRTAMHIGQGKTEVGEVDYFIDPKYGVSAKDAREIKSDHDVMVSLVQKAKRFNDATQALGITGVIFDQDKANELKSMRNELLADEQKIANSGNTRLKIMAELLFSGTPEVDSRVESVSSAIGSASNGTLAATSGTKTKLLYDKLTQQLVKFRQNNGIFTQKAGQQNQQQSPQVNQQQNKAPTRYERVLQLVKEGKDEAEITAIMGEN